VYGNTVTKRDARSLHALDHVLRLAAALTSLLVAVMIASIANAAPIEPDHPEMGSANMSRVSGGPWRSVLPTGTERTLVNVTPFYLDRVPVTNQHFLAFVMAHPEWRRDRVPAALADAGYLRHWHGPHELGATVNPQQPVTGVSWFAARAYCEARGARLPEWYEWELAAAADATQADARGQPQWQQRILGWYGRSSNQPLAVVGASTPNLYGIKDLHELVWEWVEDFNALMVSGDSRSGDDPDLLEFCGSGALSFEDRENYAMAMRIALLSSLEASSTTANLGFRCARD
jgi:sulfatase modifying factor 1